ncbi:hypothetical protein [Mycobacterium branderi]|uniref:Outer membrane protein n=1 Tax=Mycobacterium branderi TaxID=43348 RepID=A0A7I7WFN1_9MYCO|nr:hypothetical protein [Mycobacterium branderi]MCV7231762.1 hypothetical protein [Mycobacterium branderi]ORA40455.1 hypothetical protein BST20_06895 [Mycobacterium branderi]BBZ15585.1 hypothetical protein MBRA_57800 [Mycobacterium branderi]
MRVDTDATTEQDASKVSEETTEQVADAADEPDDAAGADAACGSGDEPDVASSEDAEPDSAESEGAEDAAPAAPKRRIKWPQIKWSHVSAFGVLPILALLLGAGAAFVKWQDSWARLSETASIESVTAAKESTVALLSYQPDSVEKDLGAARDRLTGSFKDSYTQLTHDIVIPGAKKDHIAAVATVPAAASVSATPRHAVVLLFVDQRVTVGTDAPTDSASSVRVTLDKSGDRWFISGFDPV